MKIVVRILANIDKDTSLDVQSCDTVGDLKTAIHEKERILKHHQLLVFDDCLLLNDDATLSDCHFTDSCVVYLLLSAEPGEGSNVPTDGVQDQRNVGLELVDPAINVEAIEQFREDWRSEINEKRRLKEAELQSQLAEKEKKFTQSEINSKVPLPEVNTKLPLPEVKVPLPEVNTKLPLPEVKGKLLFFAVPQKGLAKAAASSEEQLRHARHYADKTEKLFEVKVAKAKSKMAEAQAKKDEEYRVKMEELQAKREEELMKSRTVTLVSTHQEAIQFLSAHRRFLAVVMPVQAIDPLIKLSSSVSKDYDLPVAIVYKEDAAKVFLTRDNVQGHHYVDGNQVAVLECEVLVAKDLYEFLDKHTRDRFNKGVSK